MRTFSILSTTGATAYINATVPPLNFDPFQVQARALSIWNHSFTSVGIIRLDAVLTILHTSKAPSIVLGPLISNSYSRSALSNYLFTLFQNQLHPEQGPHRY